MTKSQNTENEQQKDLCITVEQQVWESTLHRSMVLQAENDKLKEQINHLSRTQARQFVDNQKLQVKAEKAKDVVNIDTARQIKQLKELLKDCRHIIGIEKDFATCHFEEYTLVELLTKIDEALR